MKEYATLFGAAALLLALPAMAQETAYTTTGVTLDAGPDTDYPAVVELAPNTPVDLWGCLDGWTWCDVSYSDARGWVPAQDLAFPYEDQSLPIATYGPELSLPIVVFSFGDYWDRHYRDRPFFRERERWEHHAPPPPPPHRPPPPPLRHEGAREHEGVRPPVAAPRPQPMEQRPQPVMRPPEQRPVEQRPIEQRPPEQRMPEQRMPEQRMPEQRVPEQRAPEQRPQAAPPPRPQPAPHPQEERREPQPGEQPR